MLFRSVWLFINETRLIMKEKNFNVLLGIAFTTACYIAIGLLLTIIVKFVITPVLFRKFLWIFYGLAIAGFVAAASLRSLIKLIRRLLK